MKNRTTQIKRANGATPQDSNRGKLRSDFPKHTLDEAIRVAEALEEANGGQPYPPIETATALGLSPGNSEFRILLSSSIKYGLTLIACAKLHRQPTICLEAGICLKNAEQARVDSAQIELFSQRKPQSKLRVLKAVPNGAARARKLRIHYHMAVPGWVSGQSCIPFVERHGCFSN